VTADVVAPVTLSSSSREHVKRISDWMRFLSIAGMIALTLLFASLVTGAIATHDESARRIFSYFLALPVVLMIPVSQVFRTSKSLRGMRRNARMKDLVVPMRHLRATLGWMLALLILGQVPSLYFLARGKKGVLQYNRQERTIASMRAIHAAIDKYVMDQQHLPQCRSYDELRAILEGNGSIGLPEDDGWQRPFEYDLFPNTESAVAYRLVSFGKDGVRSGETNDPEDQDIVSSCGLFIEGPPSLVPPKEKR